MPTCWPESDRLCAFIQMLTTCQLVLLTPTSHNPEQLPLCIANTHLFFHPRAAHLRTLMTAAIVTEAQHVIEAWTQQQSVLAGAEQVRQPALLFCGDFNSDQNDGMPGMRRGVQNCGSEPSCRHDMGPCSWRPKSLALLHAARACMQCKPVIL